MPQIMIDTTVESAESLLRMAFYLRDLAKLMNADIEIPAATIISPAAPPAPSPITRDPAKLFGGNAVPSIPVASDGSVICAPQVPVADSVIDPVVPVDQSGTQWDARIHSASKAFTADGSWRKRRNLSPGVYESVMSELKGAPVGVPAGTPGFSVPTPAVPIAMAPATSTMNPISALAPAPNTPPIPPSLTVTLSLPQSPAAGGTPPVPTGTVSSEVKTFRALMQQLQPLLGSGKLPQDTINALLAQNGITGFQDLSSQPMLIPKFWADVQGVL